LQVATGSVVAGGQSGARQRTAAQAAFQASASCLARFVVSTRTQVSAAQQPLASFTGSAPYMVVVQSASVAQSAPPGGVGLWSGAGVAGGACSGVGVGLGVGPGAAWSFGEEQATTSTRKSARMGRLWH
jgi:hypothetical protein